MLRLTGIMGRSNFPGRVCMYVCQMCNILFRIMKIFTRKSAHAIKYLYSVVYNKIICMLSQWVSLGSGGWYSL